MAAIYPTTLAELWQGNVDVDAGTLTVAAVDASYVYSGAHDFYGDVGGASVLGTPQVIAGKTYVAGLLDGTAVSYPDVAIAEVVVGLVFYLDTGVPATSRLICFQDDNSDDTTMAFTAVGGDITIDWPLGIAQL